MNRIYSIALIAGVLGIAGCQQKATTITDGASDGERGRVTDPAIPSASPASPSSPPSASGQPALIAGDRENDGYPDITPASLTPETARTEKGARANLLSWARGIELREFDQAWMLMGDAAKAQISRSEFNALFHPLREIVVAVPNGTMEGAAGSSYYSVPATITGTRANGSTTLLKGEVVLRRVNDIEGATPAQLAWHIVTVDLKPV